MKNLKHLALLTILYFVFGKLALLLSSPPGFVSPVWPAAGIALCFVLVYGHRLWPGVFLGSFLVNFWESGTVIGTASLTDLLILPSAIGLGAAAQALIGAYLIKKFIRGNTVLAHARDIVGFLFVGGILACTVNPTIGVTSLVLNHVISPHNLLVPWLTWWIGDTLGVFLFAPLTLMIISPAKEAWKRRRLILTAPLLILFLSIITLFAIYRHNQSFQISRLVRSEGFVFKEIVERKLREITLTLNAIQGFYVGSKFVDRREFRDFVANIRKNTTGMKSIAWVPKVSFDKRAQFIGMAKEDGFGDYDIKDIDKNGDLRPAANRDIYYPVFYIEPLENNQSALGIDNGSELKRLDVLKQCADSGLFCVSSPFVLRQDKNSAHKSLLFVAPVYINNTPVNTVEQRRKNLNGFITIAVKISLFIKDSEEKGLLKDINMVIFEESGASSETIYGDPSIIGSSKFKNMIAEIDFDLANKKWKLFFVPTEEFIKKHQTWNLWFLAVFILTMGGLLNILFLVVTGQTIAIVKLVDQKTAELEDSKKSLEQKVLEHTKLLEQMTKQTQILEDQRTATLNILDDSEQARKQAEKAELEIREKTEKIHAIIKSANEAFISVDQHGIILEWNPQATEIFGFKHDEAVGKLLSDLILPVKYRQAFRARIEKFARTGKGTALNKLIELTAMRKNGEEFPVEFTISPLKTAQGYVFNSFLRDITSRKKHEEEIKRSNQELEQFAYVASHDLQEPIRKIVGFIQLFEKRFEGKMDKTSKEYMDFIVTGAKRMQTLILDLLKLSRVTKSDSEYADTDINETLKEAIDNLQTFIAEKNAEVTYETMPTIKVLRGLVVQLFQNLIGNGIKYCDKDTPKVHVGAIEHDFEWEFSVSDNGIGIEKEFYEKVFIIFQRLHAREKYTGTGIGLALCKKIIERHGGRIWIEPAHERGTIFKFTLPKKTERKYP